MLKSNIDLFNTFVLTYTQYHINYLSTILKELTFLYDSTNQSINFDNINLEQIEYKKEKDFYNNNLFNFTFIKSIKNNFHNKINYKELLYYYKNIFIKFNIIFFHVIIIYIYYTF